MSPNSTFNLDDPVIVKPGVIDPDMGIPIGGWQGRISDIDADNNLVCVDWDSLTLESMPENMLARCEAENLGWDQVYLEETQVEATTARDTPAEVAAAKAKLEKQHPLQKVAEASKAAPAAGDDPSVILAGRAVMLREIRSWGLWSLVLGGIHLASNGVLNAPWGILLLIVGLASFYFREASMFVVYGVTLSWAAISNMVGGSGGWMVFAVFQLFLAFQVFRSFFRFRKVELAYAAYQVRDDPFGRPAPAGPAGRIFPWAGCLLGGLALGSLVSIITMVFVKVIFEEETALPQFVGPWEGLAVDMGILGLAVGLASFLSGYEYKPAAAAGGLAGALVLLIEIGLVWLG